MTDVPAELAGDLAELLPENKSGVGVLVAVPTRGHVWYETARALAPYHPQYEREKLSVASGRNRIVRKFLETNADALVMVDDDVIPTPGFVEKLLEAKYDVVGAPVAIAKLPQHPLFLNVFDVEDNGAIVNVPPQTTGHQRVDAVGSGCILIHRRVLEDHRMKRPFDQQLNENGEILVGQDLEFCRRVRAFGYTIGVNWEVVCDHYVSLHLNAAQQMIAEKFAAPVAA